MNIIASFFLLFLTPTDKIPQAGFWANDHDTLIITNTKIYYTSSPDILWMCSNTGKVYSSGITGFLVGSCEKGGAEILLAAKDTLYVTTTYKCTKYMRFDHIK